MRKRRFMFAVIKVEIVSAEIENLLMCAASSGIELMNVIKEKALTVSAYLARKDFIRMEKLCEKQGASLRILEENGLYWKFISVLHRPILVTGMLFLLAAVYILPSRVLFVRVEGNVRIPTNQILSAAEECGISFGASRRAVRSEKLKNALLSELPDLQWAGINTKGCVAVISVREREKTDATMKENSVTNLVAACDGYIISGTVTGGNGLFHPGQTVKRGQVLISGYTDCGTFIRGTRAEGEVTAQTKKTIDAIFVGSYIKKGYRKERSYKITLKFRKKRINLWKGSGISDIICDRIYKEYYIPLPGGFSLPAALCVEVFEHHDTVSEIYTREQAEEEIEAFAKRYLLSQMIAGQILQKTESVSLSDGVYRLTGSYICTEMICREKWVQIGDTHGKTD